MMFSFIGLQTNFDRSHGSFKTVNMVDKGFVRAGIAFSFLDDDLGGGGGGEREREIRA